MKKILLIAVGLTLSVLAGCAAVNDGADKAKTITAHLNTLNTKGCEAVPESARMILVVLIKSRIENYPHNGICDPDWVRDVLMDKLELLESANVIQNRSDSVGHTADSRHGQLDKPNNNGISLGAIAANSDSAKRSPNGSGLYTQDSAFVYASSLKAHQSTGIDSRLHLHAFMQVVHQEGSRSNTAGSNGLCGVPGSNVETQCGLFSGTDWRQG